MLEVRSYPDFMSA